MVFSLGSHLRVFQQEHDRLGWRNFLEGRMATKYESIQCRWYKKIGSRRSSQKWAADFITQLIKLTNLQWTYRNNFVHYRRHSGDETAIEYEDRMERIIDTFEWVDPDELCPEDSHLVDSHSPASLATATSDARIAWEESMRAALAAAEHIRRKHTLERLDCEDYDMLQTSHFPRNTPNQRASTFKRPKR